jgi:hypothetical protein
MSGWYSIFDQSQITVRSDRKLSITRRVSTSNNDLPTDLGFSRLYKFIRASLAEPNESKRTIVADKDYSFTVRVQHSTGDFEDRIVRISKGQMLHFFRADSHDKTRPERFMFDEEDHSWVVNAATGVVLFRNDTIHIPSRMSHGKFNGKIAGAGLSLG